MQEAIELFKNLINPEWILNHGGVILLLIVVFAETGLFLGFFLPGDSLLFVTGMVLSKIDLTLISAIQLSIMPCIISISIAAILGNLVGYWFGAKSGVMLFKRKDTLLYKKKYLYQAKEFYEKKGEITIVIARFLPIIRTFAPIVAGIVKMNYKKFLTYNILGSIVWVSSLVTLGYFLGRIFPALKDHLDLIVVIIVLVTTIPVLYNLFKKKLQKGKN